MMILAKIALIILYLLAFLLGIVILILVIPFSYSGFLKTYNTSVNGTATVKWAWGLVGGRFIFQEKNQYQLIIFGRTIFTRDMEQKSKKPAKERKKKKKVKEKSKKSIGIKDLAPRELLEIAIEFLKKLLEILRPKYFRLSGRYGFEDPSLTGIVSGITAILQGSLNKADIQLYPDFREEAVELEIEFYGSIMLISFVFLAIATIIKRPVRKLVFRKKKVPKLKPKTD